MSKNLGRRQSQWRMRPELAANAGILAPVSSHIKDQRDKAHAFQTEYQAAKRNYESILGCHTLECSERALRTHGILCSASGVENAQALGCDGGYFQCNQNKMLQDTGSFLLPWGCLGASGDRRMRGPHLFGFWPFKNNLTHLHLG